tara:strand:+ start:642 stop:1157 length:516 start_codon:yes stop_codon:yes gene_type:complete
MARDLSTGRFVKTEQALNTIGDILIQEFRQYLVENDKYVQTDGVGLADSFVKTVDDKILEVFSTKSYSSFVDQGMPPGRKQNIKRLIQWAKLRNITPRYLGGKQRGRFMSFSTWARYLNRKLVNKGYEGINYVGNSYVKLADIIEKTLGEAYQEDIRNMLDRNISQINDAN